jgi:hypothetical protein
MHGQLLWRVWCVLVHPQSLRRPRAAGCGHRGSSGAGGALPLALVLLLARRGPLLLLPARLRLARLLL